MRVSFTPLKTARLPEALGLMRRFYTEESLDFREPRARTALEQLVADPALGILCFIKLDGHPVGYFVITTCFSLEFGGRFALLDEFYVVPEFRGAGIGAQAIARIQQESTRLGVAALRLEVDLHNPRIQAFYQRNGFAPHGRDLMTKWLDA